MFGGRFNTTLPGVSIFDGGVGYGAVDSMLFSGLSSVGGRPLDSYISELDSILDISGGGWSAHSSGYSRFLGTSPLSLSRNFNYMRWGWGGDWGMSHYLLALSRPYYNPFADIFSQFQFSPSDGGAFDFTPNFSPSAFPQSSIPDYGTYAPPSRNSGHSGGTTRIIKEQPRPVTPGPVTVPPAATELADGFSGGGGKAGKPKIETAVEDINGKRHPVMVLKYNEGVKKDGKAVKELAARLAEELNKNKDLIIVVGGERFSADDSLRPAGVRAPDDMEQFINEEIDSASQTAANGDGDLTFGEFARTFVKGPGFMVNTDTNGHYYVDASREEGEKVIAERLISQGTREEAWVYVEYTDDTGFHRRWFECGKGEGDGNVTADLTFISDLQSRANDVKAISVYHQHPLKKGQSGYSWPSGQDLLSANNRSGIALTIPLDTRVITREGVYSISSPNGANPVVIEEKINDEYNDGIRSAVKGSADSPHTGTVSATGLNCAFRYFEKPAGDPLSEAPEDIRKFIADGRSFDIAWRANGDAFFVLRKEVQEKEKQDVLQDMRSLFGEYDNYYVVVDGKTYSLHEPNEVERKRGIKGVSKIIADAEPAMEEEEESAADAGRGPEPPAVRPREGPSSAPPERSADAAVKGRPTDDAQGRADRGGIELASKVVPDPKAPPPPLPRAPEPVPASSPTVADALRMKMADERAFIEAGGMRFVADDEFRVNTDPDEHYFVIADRETGERAIASRLVDGSDREEGWVYVEGTVETDEDGDGIKEERTVTIWFECGVGEKDGALDTKHIERFLKSDLFGRFTNVKEPSVYHQHPIDKGGVWSEKSIYPSDADLEVAVERLSPLFKGRSYDFNVITSCGVYTLTVPAGMRKIDKKMLARYREDIVGRTFKTPDRCQDMVCKTGLSCKFKYFDPKMKAVLGRVEKVYGMQKLIRDINVEMQRTTVDQRALAAKKAELRSIINGLPADIKAKYNYLAAFDPAGLTTSQLNQIKVQLRNALLDVLEKEIGGSELSRGYPAFEKQVSNFIHTLRLGGSEELAKK